MLQQTTKEHTITTQANITQGTQETFETTTWM
jgi:hypothetical protein